MSDGDWLMRVENGLAAHFKEPNGGSRLGVHWAIGLKRGAETHTVLVKALLTDDATSATRRNQEYQGQTAMQYLNDQLKGGWHPTERREHTIYIGNPLSVEVAEPPAGTRKPWWKVW